MSIVSRLLQRDAADGPGVDADGITITPLRRRHLKAVMAIEKQVYPRPWTQGVFLSELEQMRKGHRLYVVALRGTTVLGYGGLMLLPDEAHVTNIAVDPALHRNGVGRRLMVHLAHEARRVGANALSLEVRVSNLAAQAMYRRFGFVPAGIRQKYYENTEDAIVMWAQDIDSATYAELLRGIESGHGGAGHAATGDEGVDR